MKQKGFVHFLLLLVVVLVLFVGVGYFAYKNGQIIFPSNNKNLSPSSSTTSIDDTTKWKTYKNNFYHISFDIPESWNISEYKRDDGRPAFKLSSPEGLVSIETPLPESKQERLENGVKDNYRTKTKLEDSTVQIGEYTDYRGRFINDFDEVMDYLTLSNIPHQKIIGLFFRVGGDYETNNQVLLSVLKTFKFTQEEPSLKTFISYRLPTGWRDENINSKLETGDSLSFISPDYKPSEGVGIDIGASLRVSRSLKDPRRSLTGFIEQMLPLPLEKESAQAQKVKIGNEEGLNLFTCWEGCYDGYYLEDGDYYWTIIFSCADNCSTKTGMNASRYVEDRDVFLNSFSFK